jgi:sulfate transport system permease protein
MSANSMELSSSKNIVKGGRASRIGLRTIAMGYLAALLLVPVLMIVFKAFEDGAGNIIDTLTTPEAIHAFWLTMVMVAVAIPLNTVFGIACAMVLVRDKFKGKWFINALIDLPFAISPVVIGLALVLVYGSVDGVFGKWLIEHGIRVIFTPIGMAIATTFVSLPFVVREIEPVLREIGTDQEQAASTLGASSWQTFWRITLPAIRWGLTYGVVLATARALGEFGAVSIVSGRISGETETLPLFVQKQFEVFNVSGAYASALVLAIIALVTLGAMNLVRRRDSSSVSPYQIAGDRDNAEEAPV